MPLPSAPLYIYALAAAPWSYMLLLLQEHDAGQRLAAPTGADLPRLRGSPALRLKQAYWNRGGSHWNRVFVSSTVLMGLFLVLF